MTPTVPLWCPDFSSAATMMFTFMFLCEIPQQLDQFATTFGTHIQSKYPAFVTLPVSPQQLVDIHVVILHKEEGAGLGFSIAGGSDLESKATTVSSSLHIHIDFWG